jgi:hypothetical protein
VSAVVHAAIGSTLLRSIGSMRPLV